MPRAVILSAVRTPIGRYGGALSGVRPDDLAAVAIDAAVERAGIDGSAVDDVYLGCANQAGEDNRNVARMTVRNRVTKPRDRAVAALSLEARARRGSTATAVDICR